MHKTLGFKYKTLTDGITAYLVSHSGISLNHRILQTNLNGFRKPVLSTQALSEVEMQMHISKI